MDEMLRFLAPTDSFCSAGCRGRLDVKTKQLHRELLLREDPGHHPTCTGRPLLHKAFALEVCSALRM